MFAKTELESMKYHEIVNLAKSNNLVFKSRKKKAYLINRLLSLWNVQEDEEYLSASENSDKSVMFKSFESVDRRETFTIPSPAPNISLVANFKYQDQNFAKSEEWCGRLRSGKSSVLPRSPLHSVVESSMETGNRNENQPKKNSSNDSRRETFDIIPNKYHANITPAVNVDDSFTIAIRRETFDIIPDDNHANITSAVNVDDSFTIDNRRETFDVIPDDDKENTSEDPERTPGILIRQNTFEIIVNDRNRRYKHSDAHFDESSLKTDGKRETSIVLPDKMDITNKSVDVSLLSSLVMPTPRVPCSPLIARLSTPKKIASPGRQFSGQLLSTRISSPKATRFSTPKKIIASPSVLASAQLPPRSARPVTIRTAHSERVLKSGKNRMLLSAMKRAALDSSKKNILSIAKGGKVGKKLTPLKLPNFNKLHTQLFKDMESIVDYAERRAKSRIPVKSSLNPSLNVNIVPGPSISKLNKKGEAAEIVQSADKPSTCGTVKMTERKVGIARALPQKTQVVKKVAKPTTVGGRAGVKRPGSATKQLATDLVTKKIRPFSAEKNREKERSLHQLVRTNKRFELQMNIMRKAKV